MAKTSYLDFDLLIDQSKSGFRVQVLNAPAGVERVSSEFTLPFDERDIKIFLLSIGQSRRGVRRIGSPQSDEVKKFGGDLFDAIFTKDVWACLRRSLDICTEQDVGLRIRLQLTKDAQVLANLPWEYLYDRDLNRFLALSSETPITRYLALPESVRPLAIRLPLRILVMISSPTDYPSLDTDLEWHNLQEALQDLHAAGLVVAERMDDATLAGLQRRLRRGEYHIFHFIGHGGFDEATQDGVLLLEDSNGRGRAVSGQDLGTLLRDHRPLRLAILNACDGARASSADPFAGTAQSLVQQGIPAVIAMQFEISDTAAIAFSHEFYGAVADGYPVDAALSEARKAVYAQMTDVEWGTPVLFMRSPDGRVFDLPNATFSPMSPEQIRPQGEPRPRPDAHPLRPVSKPHVGLPEPSPQRLPPPNLDEYYTQALEHFYTERWADAVTLFDKIIALQPSYPGAAVKLEEARRQQTLASSYSEARRSYDDGQWATAIEHLQAIITLDPGYKDAAASLTVAERQRTLAELYAEARRLSNAQTWHPVVKVFDHIHELDATYPDPDHLLQSACEALAAQEQERALADLYNQAVRNLDAGRLNDARLGFEEVARLSPGYKQVDILLTHALSAIAQREAESQRQTKLVELSQLATDLVAARDWNKAEAVLVELRKIGASEAELSAQLAELERQRNLEGLYRQGFASFQAGRWKDANAAFQVLLQSEPNYVHPIHGRASDLLLRARQQRELEELPPPPPSTGNKPSGLPRERMPSEQPETRSNATKPGTKPKDLPR